MGLKARKETNRKRAKTLGELEKENSNLRKEQDKHDDQMMELDVELRETKIELAKTKERNEILEKEKEQDCFQHDDWVSKVVKNMSIEGRTEFRNAFTAAAPSLNRGTISRLRKTTKLNFSNITTNLSDEASDLKKKD